LVADAISRDIMPERLPSAADAPGQYVELFLHAIGYHSAKERRS
jgi:hypothetical protein